MRSWASAPHSAHSWVLDWAPAEHEGDELLFIFDGGILDAEQLAAIQLQPAELELRPPSTTYHPQAPPRASPAPPLVRLAGHPPRR